VVSHYPTSYDPVTKKPKYEDTDIWIESLDGSFKKRVTYGKEYQTPKLSPDGSRILVDDFVVLDLNGNELINLSPGSRKLSKDMISIPCCSEWSPDGKQIVYVAEIDNDATQQIEGSDLYIINVDGSGRVQITDTPDKIEMDPEWSPDGKSLAYWTENTGKIFVIKLK
jgi:TolB protein